MNNILSLNISTPSEIATQIASRIKARRLELNLTQDGIARRAGLNLPLTDASSKPEKFLYEAFFKSDLH